MKVDWSERNIALGVYKTHHYLPIELANLRLTALSRDLGSDSSLSKLEFDLTPVDIGKRVVSIFGYNPSEDKGFRKAKKSRSNFLKFLSYALEDRPIPKNFEDVLTMSHRLAEMLNDTGTNDISDLAWIFGLSGFRASPDWINDQRNYVLNPNGVFDPQMNYFLKVKSDKGSSHLLILKPSELLNKVYSRKG